MIENEYTDLYENYGDYLTPKELATYLGIHYNTVYELLSKRKIKGKRIGRKWRIPRHRVVEFLEQTV